LRGTPFLYMGEELGLEDAEVPPERVVDPGGRDGCRAPIPWTRGPSHGWPASPWLPFAPDAAPRSVEAQREDADSVLHLYRRLLAARRDSPALRLGSMKILDGPAGLFVYRRDAGDDRRWVVVNFRDEPTPLELDGSLSVEVASDGAEEGEPFRGRVGADQALILA
jgi:alpha-glucosidase